MIEWLRWVLILGLVAGAYLEGKRQGVTEKTVDTLTQDVKERDEVIADLREQADSGKAQDEQERVELAALNESIEQLAARSGSIGAQLRSALNASSLALCVHPDDVRSVRNAGYEQARSAAATANQARSALRDNPL